MAARPRRRPLSREEAWRFSSAGAPAGDGGGEPGTGPGSHRPAVSGADDAFDGIGLIMLLSASFPSAYYETEGSNPMSYFIRQGVFAIMGVAAMLLIGKINYQRFRAPGKAAFVPGCFCCCWC